MLKFDKEYFSFSDGIFRTKKLIKTNFIFKGEVITIKVPSNFGWNGVTSFRTTMKSFIPSMIHDWLIFDRRIHGNKIFTRKQMDEIFIVLCNIYGVPTWEIALFRAGLAYQRNKVKLLGGEEDGNK